MKNIRESIICAGSGGQGIVLMGKFLAYAAMQSGYHVTWIPAYGAEVRGGTSYSMVRIQNDEIANPVIAKPNSCIVMNEPSMIKYIKVVEKKGLFLVDSSTVSVIPKNKDIDIKSAPFTKEALALGDKRAANMVAIGAFNKIKGTFTMDALISSLPFIFKDNAKAISLSEKALKIGSDIKIN
jgi:2-oxoglutarate ferredoxin oxidoreductase subunit gamma